MRGPAKRPTEMAIEMRTTGAAAFVMTTLVVACGRLPGVERDSQDGGVVVSAPSSEAIAVPRPRMAWVPAGILHAGSEIDEAPRVAEAELPGVDLPMSGFYIDILPWPNESGAIPTTNVTRDEATRLCEDKGKRLCSELEWERACKGPNNAPFEYGSTYDARACEAGVSADTAAQRPSAQRPACRSALGVRDMHGGASEWTDSHWGRGTSRDLGVVRGGSDVAGELATRCAFARALAPGERSSTIGFRCCAGPRNEVQVALDVTKGLPFERTAHATLASPPLDALGGVACGPPAAPSPCSVARAWTWRPAANVELSLAGGCVGHDPSARCALGVARTAGPHTPTLAQIDTGREIPEVVLVESRDRRVRVRGADAHGLFFRELIFDYGRVDVRPVR